MDHNRDKDAANQLGPIVDDDAFIDELSRGTAPTDGDELAGLLLGLREDVEEDIPDAPTVLPAPQRRGRPWLHGLAGAAAATILIAGSGAVAYNALPWGSGSEDPAVVELAGTLEEIDTRAAEGDMAGTRELLEQARMLVDKLDEESEEEATASSTPSARPSREVPATVRITETAEPSAAPAPVEPGETVTESVTETVTTTEPVPVPVPTTVTERVTVEPAPQPTSTSATIPAETLAPPQTQTRDED